jgi:hypothetical protein
VKKEAAAPNRVQRLFCFTGEREKQRALQKCGAALQEKVLLFSENQLKFAKRERIAPVFVRNTHSLKGKRKTAVQGAENPDLKQIDMEQSTKCDKIKLDMRTCVHGTDGKQQ